MERKRRKTEDVNQIAASIVEAVTSSDRSRGGHPAKEKNPAAVVLGRLGGLKGGKARAEKLSAKKRTQIAKKAAQARWSKKT